MTLTSKTFATRLYSDSSQYSHRVRIVIAEKSIDAEIVYVDPADKSEEVSEVSPQGTLPALRDRELNLFEHGVIMEYLNDRFPYPPLLPVYPVARAQSRLLMHQMQIDWCTPADLLLSSKGNQKTRNKTRKSLGESLTASVDYFTSAPFFSSDEITLMDCCLAPLLWRLPLLELELTPRIKKAIDTYAGNIFRRESFQDSLSELEREMEK